MRKHVKGNVSWVGYLDWDLRWFHGEDYSIHHGSSQNAYLIEEEKTVLVDTVWLPHRFEFVENLASEVDLDAIDLIVANHGECDHSGSLLALMERIPDTPIYCTPNAIKSITGQYGERGWDLRPVRTGDRIDIGNGKELVFIEMRMLHWPDSMATFLTGDNVLFSMDAFGQHLAVEELFADRADQCELWHEAQKYFVNILNPFASFVTRKLAELRDLGLPIEMIAPSHGAIWRKDPAQIMDAYGRWADAYQEDQVTIAFGTMWKGTEKLAYAIANEVYRQSPSTQVKVLNIETSDKNEAMTEVLKSRAIAVGSPTYLNGILSGVEGWLSFLKSLRFQGKRAAAFGCYGWSGEGVGILKERLADAGFEVVEADARANWNPGEEEHEQVSALVAQLLAE